LVQSLTNPTTIEFPQPSVLWFIAEHGGDQGYNPNLESQPFITTLEGTDVSANSRFAIWLEKEDPSGTNTWTRATQYFGQKGKSQWRTITYW
jgi:hypothetical protein